MVDEHIADLVHQLMLIVERGVREGDFVIQDANPLLTARAVFDATGRFHDPAYAREWEQPDIEAEFTSVVDLLLRGLSR